jgi:hypothetical protein
MGVWENFQTQEPNPNPNTELKYPVLHAEKVAEKVANEAPRHLRFQVLVSHGWYSPLVPLLSLQVIQLTLCIRMFSEKAAYGNEFHIILKEQ